MASSNACLRIVLMMLTFLIASSSGLECKYYMGSSDTPTKVQSCTGGHKSCLVVKYKNKGSYLKGCSYFPNLRSCSKTEGESLPEDHAVMQILKREQDMELIDKIEDFCFCGLGSQTCTESEADDYKYNGNHIPVPTVDACTGKDNKIEYCSPPINLACASIGRDIATASPAGCYEFPHVNGSCRAMTDRDKGFARDKGFSDIEKICTCGGNNCNAPFPPRSHGSTVIPSVSGLLIALVFWGLGFWMTGC